MSTDARQENNGTTVRAGVETTSSPIRDAAADAVRRLLRWGRWAMDPEFVACARNRCERPDLVAPLPGYAFIYGWEDLSGDRMSPKRSIEHLAATIWLSGERELASVIRSHCTDLEVAARGLDYDFENTEWDEVRRRTLAPLLRLLLQVRATGLQREAPSPSIAKPPLPWEDKRISKSTRIGYRLLHWQENEDRGDGPPRIDFIAQEVGCDPSHVSRHPAYRQLREAARDSKMRRAARHARAH